MYYPKLRPRNRQRYLIDRFLGCDNRPEPQSGSFPRMKNLCGNRFPHLCVRPVRTRVSELEGCPTDRVLAIGGGKHPVILDGSGSLWSGGCCLPRLLEGTTTVYAIPPIGVSVPVLDQQAVKALIPLDGRFQFTFDRDRQQWTEADHGYVLPAAILTTEPQQDQGDSLIVRVSTTLRSTEKRQLCFLGGWVCIFPDGLYANTVRLRQGGTLVEGEDYGKIAQENACDVGSIRFEPCSIDGALRTVTRSDQPPESGFWLDTSEPEPEMKCYSSSQGLWIAANPYVRCTVPGIAKGIREGDGVDLFARLGTTEPGAKTAEDLWDGFHVVVGAYHDPGGSTRPEGANDYLIIPGLLDSSIELELTERDQKFLTLRRPLPEMDFVLSCQNRLWGCRYGDGVNELYASKLGDFRNFISFEGLSTDSWRVSRGQDSPFTGAAVLGDCPLFFRADGLEKIYPSFRGDHSVITLSLNGIEAGSASSALVIRDRLYYKSPQGICCYSGTLPVLISAPLGKEPWHNASAGALEDRYYVSMEDQNGGVSLFVYDTESGLWYREDETRICSAWTQAGSLYFTDGPLQGLQRIGGASDSDGVDWFAETGDLAPVLGTRRYVSRLRITARLDPGAELRIFLSYDGGPWQNKGAFFGNRSRSIAFPIWPRRCDRLRLRLEGRGGMELQQLSFLVEQGSDE